jgi:hypothetical protein
VLEHLPAHDGVKARVGELQLRQVRPLDLAAPRGHRAQPIDELLAHID